MSELSPENEAHIPADQALFLGGEAVDSQVDKYYALITGDDEMVSGITEQERIQAAAVQPVEHNLPHPQTTFRPGYWTKPTEPQVKAAAKHGFDLNEQNKYYS